MGNPGTPQLEMREYMPFAEDNGLDIIVCHHCGKANPENVFCDCPSGRAVAKSFDAVHRRPDRIPIPADFPVRQAHRFCINSDFCDHCGMSRAAAVNNNSVYCTAHNHIYDLAKAYWRDMRRAQNADEIAAPAIALMERHGTALAAAFALPVVPMIETLSASPSACKLLPDS